MDFGAQKDVAKVFGKAGEPLCTAGVVVPTYQMYLAWDKGSAVKKIHCHEKVAQSLSAILADISKEYTAAEIKKHGFDLFGGCYNYRNTKGGSSLSMHAYGVAVDMSPEQNQYGYSSADAYFAKKECKKFIDIWYAHGWISLGKERNYDWMHFQAPRLA